MPSRLVRALHLLPFLLFPSSPALADCSLQPGMVEKILEVRATACNGIPACLTEQITRLEALIEEQPGALPLHRLRQDFEMAAHARQRETVRGELIEHYGDDPSLSRPARRYLVARLQNDASALRSLAEQIPWARLDLMRRSVDPDEPALVEPKEAERLTEAFVRDCPGASRLLASEAPQLLVSARWPIWTEVRRALLEMEPPPWEDLDKLLIRSGLLQDAEGDPAEALLAELRSAVGDVYRGDPGYWLYRARIHVEARDIDAAIEANVRAREIDACRQISPWHRRRKENYQGFDPGWIDAITQQILNCSPDFEVYQAWMMMAFNERDGLDDRVLSRVRQATENRSLGYETYRLEKQLAQLDICCTGHDPESAWATLDRLFEAARSHRQHAEASGVDPGSRAISLALESLQFAQLALRNRFPQQAEKWRRRSDRLLEEHRHLIEQSPEMQPFLTVLKAVRSELEWLQARLDNRHADAVVHALAARANRHPWVEMEEVLASWRAAGGTEESFDDLLAGWGLKLPANWRGWRRLDEPLQAFELTDMRERVWTIADLDGKRTLVNLWAVWCGPCLLELPKVQELHERYRGDPDIQVITINLDGVEGVARELMRREGYDFPVLMHGSDEPAFEDVGIPRNWLVDSEGVRRWEQTGFSGDIAEHWVDDIASLIEGIE